MSGQRIGRRRERHLIAPPVGDLADSAKPADIARAISEVRDKVAEVIPGGVYVADVDLSIGDNVINHGLNRKPVLVTVVPKTPDATAAWGWDPEQPSNPAPARITTIVVSGAAFTGRVVVE